MKTHILCSTTWFENRTVQKKRRKNMVEPERLQMTIKYAACTLHAG
jgi:hypothetical protein